MKKGNSFSYYDGPVKDSGRTLEEIEEAIEKEKERCDGIDVYKRQGEHIGECRQCCRY